MLEGEGPRPIPDYATKSPSSLGLTAIPQWGILATPQRHPQKCHPLNIETRVPGAFRFSYPKFLSLLWLLGWQPGRQLSQKVRPRGPCHLSPCRAKANPGPGPGTQTAESFRHFEMSSFV